MKLFEIIQNKMTPAQAYNYGEIHGPNPELEGIIATDALYSYYYAANILRGRFHEGEKAISTNPIYAFCYAKYILHRRWLRAETIIKKGLDWNEYKDYFNIR